ncbi:MAG: hypothetical protein RI975_914 [Pseudomonadota bacterium]|jgi:integrase
MKIETVDGRSKLKPRTATYWKKISTGRSIGFRKTTSQSEGSWLGQYYDPATQKQIRFSIGDLSHLPKHQRFDGALKELEQRFSLLDHGINTDICTVGDACRAYVEHLEEIGRHKTSKETHARFKRWVYDDSIDKVELLKLSRSNLSDWRLRVSKTTLLSNDQQTVAKGPRSQATVNRDITALRAALNHAFECNQITSNAAWRSALKATPNADSRRHVYLDKDERIRLIDASASDLGLFLKAMNLLPLRPSAVADLRVEDIDLKRLTLHIRTDKTKANRNVTLPLQTAQYFFDQTHGKLNTDKLFTREDGRPWDKDMWKHPVKQAVQQAKLPEAVTIYTMRHSGITDLVVAGLPLLTIAQITGTSVQMIERHYGHLSAQMSQDALSLLLDS